MNKDEMMKKTALYDGVGLEVTDPNGTSYYFYENFEGDDGISRAYRHFNKGEKLVFYSQTWARQTYFKQYMETYKKLVEESNNAEKDFFANPYSINAENTFKEAYFKQIEYLFVMCRRLIDWTKCDFESAKKQIITDTVLYSRISEQKGV